MGSEEFLNNKSAYVRESQMQDQNVLAELADGTGGAYFHNNNDLGLGSGVWRARPSSSMSWILAAQRKNGRQLPRARESR